MSDDEWAEIYRTKFADGSTPGHWPKDVRPISLNGVSLLGVSQSTGELHWDGRSVQTVARLGFIERMFAAVVAGSSVVLAAIEVARFVHEVGSWGSAATPGL